MSKNRQGLRLNVVAPCREDWDGMTGGDDIRFCGRCRQNVYNLSAMTETQVRELVQAGACVRFYARADGTVVTSKCPPMLMAARKRVLAIVACIVPLFVGFWGSVSWLRGLIHGDSDAIVEPIRPMMGAPVAMPPPLTEEQVPPRPRPHH